MRLDIARKVTSGRNVHRPLISQIARGKARPQQCPEYGPTDLSGKTKAANNWSGLGATISESTATESARSPLTDIQPRAPAASTPQQWFNNRLWQIIRGAVSKEVADALRGLLQMSHMTNSRRARLGYEPLQKFPPVVVESGRSLHVVRLLQALKQWDSRRLDLTPRQKLRLKSHDKLFRHIRLALDSNQAQPDETADTIFLFGQGFVEILKAGTRGHIRGPDLFESDSSGPYCIKVLTHLIKDINTQLAEDINNVVSKRRLQLFEDGTKILSVSTSGLLSPRDYNEILARLSPALQQGIQNGLLYDVATFRYAVLKEKPRAKVWDALASLIDHELSRPRKRSERHHAYETRRASLLANTQWIRHKNSPRGTKAQTSHQKYEAMAKLKMMFRWRDYHLSRLRVYRQSRGGSIGTKRRMTQIKANIDEITMAILHLQSANSDMQSIPERETVPARSSTEEPLEEAPAIDVSIELKPAALSDSMIFQLSRELLDGFNEAAYTFGQQYAPAMMQKGGWTGPEKIDLPIFISSFHLSPDLSGQIIKYQGVFHRLREFRNHTAHGGGNMTTGDILLTLTDFAAAARFFRTPGWAAQIERYRTLLREFTATQNEHLREAYEIVRPFTKRLRAKLERSKSVSKDGESDTDRARAQSAASVAARIKETWTHTEQSLLQLDARQITRCVGEAQIRRITRNMGSDASTVLTKLQKEQAGRPNEAFITPGVKEIFTTLSEKLSQSEGQHEDSPHTNAKANDITANSAIGPYQYGLTPDMLDRLPSGRAGKAQQQNEELRQLAHKVRMDRT